MSEISEMVRNVRHVKPKPPTDYHIPYQQTLDQKNSFSYIFLASGIDNTYTPNFVERLRITMNHLHIKNIKYMTLVHDKFIYLCLHTFPTYTSEMSEMSELSRMSETWEMAEKIEICEIYLERVCVGSVLALTCACIEIFTFQITNMQL